MEPIIKCSAGLDVHKELIVVTVLKALEDGTVNNSVKEFSTYPEDLKQLAKWLLEEKVELAVMESTGVYWKSVYNALETECIKTYVVNAKHVKQVPGRKTDINDSCWLASLARYGLLKASFIPELELRNLRLLTRYRIKLNGMIASEVNRMHKVLDDSGIRLGVIFSDLQGLSAAGVIDGLINGESIGSLLSKLKGTTKKKSKQLLAMVDQHLSNYHRLALKEISDHIQYLRDTCSRLELEIFAAMKDYNEQWQVLQTIPGIDKVSAASIIAEIGVDMQRFGSSERFSSWAGMCPGNNESAGKRKSGRITKGAPTLRSNLCQIANSAIKTTSQFKGFYQGLMLRRGHKRAVIAVGHKLLRVIYKLLSTTKPYADPEVNYEALVVKRNAPRWIQALTKYGYVTQSPIVG